MAEVDVAVPGPGMTGVPSGETVSAAAQNACEGMHCVAHGGKVFQAQEYPHGHGYEHEPQEHPQPLGQPAAGLQFLSALAAIKIVQFRRLGALGAVDLDIVHGGSRS